MNPEIISFAINAHHNTNHSYDGNPYSVHLAMVVIYAQKYIKYIPEEDRDIVLAACWLHDTIEDCRLSYNDIMKVAGYEAAEIVYAVTNEKGRDRLARASNKYYGEIRSTPYAAFVKLCDRAANIEYSTYKRSSMFEKYKEENDRFMVQLFGTDLRKKNVPLKFKDYEFPLYRDITNLLDL